MLNHLKEPHHEKNKILQYGHTLPNQIFCIKENTISSRFPETTHIIKYRVRVRHIPKQCLVIVKQ